MPSEQILTDESSDRDLRDDLTVAGRRNFARKDESHLKPGVKKPSGEMSAEEMRRKGSCAARFYGRTETLPPLQDKHGKPTRFALTAAAWGEPVPKTVAAARRIAAMGNAAAVGEENETSGVICNVRPS